MTEECAALLRELRDAVYALPSEGRRHVGDFVERAAVIALLDPKRPRQSAERHDDYAPKWPGQ